MADDDSKGQLFDPKFSWANIIVIGLAALSAVVSQEVYQWNRFWSMAEDLAEMRIKLEVQAAGANRTKEDISDIKESQKAMNDKLDRLLQQRFLSPQSPMQPR